MPGRGRAPRFYDLLRGRGVPRFVAFDCLALGARDLRRLPLIERKRVLRSLVPRRCASLLYAGHVRGRGRALFAAVCERDLEGVVLKHARGTYVSEAPTSWIKVKWRGYSQAEGRHEFFDARRPPRALVGREGA